MTEGRSITDVVMMFGAKVAARRVRNVFDAQEFESALKARAAVEAKRLGHKKEVKADDKSYAFVGRALNDGLAAYPLRSAAL